MRIKYLEIARNIPSDLVNPSENDLNALCESHKITNNRNLAIFKSKITARSAKFTTVLDSNQDEETRQKLNKVFNFVDPNDYIMMKLQVGQSNAVRLNATVIISKQNANKALMLRRNFYLSDHDLDASDIMTLDLPQFPQRKVYVDPVNRLTIVLGIDYYGEMKMSILRMAMEIMRRDKGGLGLHAGSKTYQLKINDRIEEKGALIFGLSGTGKTTLTCHDHGLQKPEGVVILQDDINLITESGQSYGSEKGFYVKCDACPDHEQITKAVLSKNSILENVHVNDDGSIDWKNFTHTYNSRAIVERSSLEGTGDTIDLPSLDFILYNTRRPELPPIGRLTSPAQGAAYYGLGESIITSAEDPNRVGESKRQVGFDPFILGDEAININRMKKIIENNPHLECFVVNTGYVGKEENDITIPITLACIEQAIRGEVDWVFDDDLGYEIPKNINGIDWTKFLPQNFYGKAKFANLMESLRTERKNHLNRFQGIEQDIMDTI